MIEEENLSNYEKTELKARQQGKSIMEVIVEDVLNESRSSQLKPVFDKESTITLNNLLAIREAMEEIQVKERSTFFQQYYDELVYTIVDLRQKNG